LGADANSGNDAFESDNDLYDDIDDAPPTTTDDTTSDEEVWPVSNDNLIEADGTFSAPSGLNDLAAVKTAFNELETDEAGLFTSLLNRLFAENPLLRLVFTHHPSVRAL